MQHYEAKIDIAIPNRQGEVVNRNAGDVIPESEIAAGSLDSCLRLRQLMPCDAPAPVPALAAEPVPVVTDVDKPKPKK